MRDSVVDIHVGFFIGLPGILLLRSHVLFYCNLHVLHSLPEISVGRRYFYTYTNQRLPRSNPT